MRHLVDHIVKVRRRRWRALSRIVKTVQTAPPLSSDSTTAVLLSALQSGRCDMFRHLQYAVKVKSASSSRHRESCSNASWVSGAGHIFEAFVVKSQKEFSDASSGPYHVDREHLCEKP